MNRFMNSRVWMASVALLAVLSAAEIATAGCGKIEPPTYHVYSRGCSRSEWRLVLATSDIWKAHEASEKARKEARNVVVTKGALKTPWSIAPARYEVYRRTCKASDLCGTTSHDWIADAIAKAAAKDNAGVLVVAVP